MPSNLLNDSRYNPISIVTRLRALRPGFGSRQWLGVLLFATASRLALRPIQTPTQWIPGALSPGVKWLQREADHVPPSRAGIKNRGALLPLPHTSSWRSI